MEIGARRSDILLAICMCRLRGGMRVKMVILSVILCICCVVLSFFYIRLRINLRSLCGQLQETENGSHIELTITSRQKPLVSLCRRLNQVLAYKDKKHIQYEKAEKQLKQNITSLAHDIRTPLTGASGYVQFARECEDSVKREHYLQIAENRLAELENMLEEMFLYTKLTGEDFTLTLRNIQVLPLLGNCFLSLYTRFEEMGITPKVTFESECFRVNADEEALRRIFLNLIQIALIHGSGGISVIQRGHSLIFENPVSGDHRLQPELLFDRFYKADSARGKGSSGLGLFIVKELTEKMDGTVTAQVQDGRLRITLQFP